MNPHSSNLCHSRVNYTDFKFFLFSTDNTHYFKFLPPNGHLFFKIKPFKFVYLYLFTHFFTYLILYLPSPHFS